MDTPVNISVLLVDDKPANLVAIAAALDGLGATTVQARSGEEALKHLLDGDFAAILMDVRMPGLDGFETAEIIRQRERSRDTPIIFVTGISQADEHVARGYALGAVDYVFKPVPVDVLRSKVSVFVELERKRALVAQQAELLRQSEARYRQLVEGLPATVYTADLDGFGITRYVSPQAQAMLGFPPAAWEADRRLAERQVHPGDRRLVERQYAHAVAKRLPFSAEYRMIAADGRVVWVRDEGRLVPGADGKPDHVQGVRLDITDLRVAQESLRETKETLETMVRAAPVAVFLLNLDGSVRLTNPAAERLFGRPAAEFIGRPAPFVRRGEQLQQTMNQIVSNNEETGFELEYRRAPGDVLQLLLRGAPVRNAQGAVAAVVCLLLDVTERRRVEDELRRAKEAAEFANRELETFNSAVAHDLQAPLRSIAGFSRELLEDNAAQLDDEGRERLDRVVTAAAWMGQLIDDLLQLSNCTHTAMKEEVVDLTAIARACLDDLARAAPARNVNARIEAGLTARGDPRLLRVAVENLIRNAWKFTGRQERATIEFGRDPGTAEYFVRDNGAGFEMEHASRLFEAFQRLHRQDEFEGNGIGLITVKRIVERHRGRVRGVGAPGQGATFSFTLG